MNPKDNDLIRLHRATPMFVYAYVSRDGEVVYVGRTHNPPVRNRDHRRADWWSADLEFALVAECVGWECAKRCEKAAISDLRPRGNVHHTRSAV